MSDPLAREMVERHLDVARQLARRIDAEPEFERLADVPRERLLADGRVFAGTTLFEGKVAFRRRSSTGKPRRATWIC